VKRRAAPKRAAAPRKTKTRQPAAAVKTRQRGAAEAEPARESATGRRLGAKRLSTSLWPQIYAVVARVPRGRVVTYGQVAALAGLPRQARLVGYAMHGLPDGSTLPWHRVINAQGKVSVRSFAGPSEGLQRHLLEEEGVTFDEKERVSLKKFRWKPRASATSRPAPEQRSKSRAKRAPRRRR